MTVDMWRFEREAQLNGFTDVCGIDEAGRGPLAGPVFAAAVILPNGDCIPGVNDSKKLSPKTRERLFDLICERAVAYGIASADEREIDEINILNATFLAMQRACAALEKAPDIVLIDGNRAPELPCAAQCVVKGDSLSASIAAASILAKVSRDRFMLKLHEEFPQYEFDRHKGYPTKLHYEKLRAFGASRVHRKSFLKKFYEISVEMGVTEIKAFATSATRDSKNKDEFISLVKKEAHIDITCI
ncbi:MAG: ribonuclease HII, partial [Clostridia bacterium]